MAKSKSLIKVLDESSEERAGPLDLLQKGGLRKVKTYHAVLSNASQSGVARLELYEDIKHSLTLRPSITVVSQDVIKVEKLNCKGKENAFLISTKDHCYTFITKSSFLCTTWVKSVQDTLLGTTLEASPLPDPVIITEINDIYEPCGDFPPYTSEFIVSISEDTQDKMHVKGKVMLAVENGYINISNLLGKRIVQWDIKHIRRFGRCDSVFFLETGRRCALGEGNFRFITDQSESIMAAINRLKNTKGPVDTPEHSPNNLQLQSTSKLQSSKAPTPLQSPSFYEEFYMPEDGPSQAAAQDSRRDTIPALKPADMPCKKPEAAGKTQCKKIAATLAEQDPLYDELETIKDAWKINGCGDSNIYNNLSFPSTPSSLPSSAAKISKEKEDHYWQGTVSTLPKEPIYAPVDFSKKKKKKGNS